jgi:hypothetical protein
MYKPSNVDSAGPRTSQDRCVSVEKPLSDVVVCLGGPSWWNLQFEDG